MALQNAGGQLQFMISDEAFGAGFTIKSVWVGNVKEGCHFFFFNQLIGDVPPCKLGLMLLFGFIYGFKWICLTEHLVLCLFIACSRIKH